MYIFLDGSDHCNTFDSFGFVISCCFGGLARKSTAYKEQAKDAATCHPSKHRFSSMVGWIQFVFHHNFSGFDGQYFHVNILVSHIQCRVVHEGWKCFTVRSNFDDVMIWLEIVVLLTHHVTFLYLLQYFHPLLLGISWHITNIQWPACPGIAAATFYVSAWYCPRWVDDQLSSLTFEWRRQLQIWPDRILPVLYLLNLLNTLIFWVTFPLLHLASFSQDEEPGLRDYEVPLSIACHWGIFQPWSWLPSGFFVGLSSQRGSLAGPPEASFVRLLDKLCDGESLRAIFSEVNRIHTKKQYCFRIWHDMAANSVWLITLGPVFQNWYHEVQTSALTRQAGRVPMSPSGASPSLKFFYLCSLPNQNTTNDFYYLCTMWMIPSSDSYC